MGMKELFIQGMCHIPNSIEFGIGFVDTMTCVNGQLEFKFLAPPGEEFHKIEELCIPY